MRTNTCTTHTYTHPRTRTRTHTHAPPPPPTHTQIDSLVKSGHRYRYMFILCSNSETCCHKRHVYIWLSSPIFKRSNCYVNISNAIFLMQPSGISFFGNVHDARQRKGHDALLTPGGLVPVSNGTIYTDLWWIDY